MAMKRLDLIGIRFGKLVVIDLAPYRLEKDGRKRIMWLCKCDCGELVSKSSENLKGKWSVSCGCAKRINTAYIANAKRVHLGDYRETPFEVFLELSQQNCYWCGAPPGNKSVISNSAYSAKRIEDIRNNPFIYNGLDRLDNNRDHSVDNIVPCCKRCNFAKNNRSCQEYDEWIIRSYNHRNMRQVDFEFGSGI